MSSLLSQIRVRRSAARRDPGRERLRRGRTTALLSGLVGLGCLVSTAGCGAGFNAASLDMTPRSGAARIGSFRINNVWVVMDPVTRNAEIIGAVANTARRPQSDQLLSVTADGMPATIRPAAPEAIAAALPKEGVSISGNTVTIAGGSAISFGRPGRPGLEISNVPFTLGHLTQVEFEFAQAGRATVTTLIMPPTGLFAHYNPNGENTTVGPRVSPSASVSPGAGSTASPTSSATPSPTPSASGYALNKASKPLSTERAAASDSAVATASSAPSPARVHGRA